MKRLLPYAAAALCILYVVSWLRSDPKVDYPAFYSAGRLFREHKSVYDLSAQCALQLEVSERGCLPYPHPPLLLPLMALTAVDNFKIAHFLYGLFVLLLFVACVVPLVKITHSKLHALVLLTFLPVQQAINSTQSTPLVLLGVLLMVLFLRERRDFLAGLCLALACVKPHIALALGVPLLFTRPKAFFGFMVGGSALVVYSLLLVGPSGLKGLANIMIVMSRGEGFFINRHMMHNLTGIVYRFDLPTWPVWPAYVLGIVSISFLWRKLDISLPTIGIAVVLVVFTAPHLHLHDLSLLMIPMLALPVWVPLLATTLLVGSFGTPFLYGASYLIQVSLAIACAKRFASHLERFSPGSRSIRPTPAPSNSLPAA